MEDRWVTYDEACSILGCELSDGEIQEWFEPTAVESSSGVFRPLDGGPTRAIIRDFDLVRLSQVKRYLELRNASA